MNDNLPYFQQLILNACALNVQKNIYMLTILLIVIGIQKLIG